MGNHRSPFLAEDHVVIDMRTGLMWTRDAALDDFPMTWSDALTFISDLNEHRHCGYADWRLPNRRELFSLVYHDEINPALPQDHPFLNVFTGYYWTSTTCSRLPDQAWYIHLGGARVFKGMKYGSYMVWPVRTADFAATLPCQTGQRICYADNHTPTACSGSGQDGDLQSGRQWPLKRFTVHGEAIYDHMTGLYWKRSASQSEYPVDWQSARTMSAAANRQETDGTITWRLPNIRELESLCDMSAHSPALPPGHPFEHVRTEYWSCTTSCYDPRYAWVLYLRDGAVGVGHKPGVEFYVWLVGGAWSFVDGHQIVSIHK